MSHTLTITNRPSSSELLQELIGHQDSIHYFKCKTQKCSLGFVKHFHGNSCCNHGTTEAVIKGNEHFTACVCGSGCLRVGGLGGLRFFYQGQRAAWWYMNRWDGGVLFWWGATQNCLKPMRGRNGWKTRSEGGRSVVLESTLTWADSLIFCSNSPPTRLYFSMHSAKDSAAFLDFSSA